MGRTSITTPATRRRSSLSSWDRSKVSAQRVWFAVVLFASVGFISWLQFVVAFHKDSSSFLLVVSSKATTTSAVLQALATSKSSSSSSSSPLSNKTGSDTITKDSTSVQHVDKQQSNTNKDLLSRKEAKQQQQQPLQQQQQKQQQKQRQEPLSLLSVSAPQEPVVSAAYQREFDRVTWPDPTQKTLAFAPMSFYSGFCNELMAFSAFVMYAVDNNFTQIFLPSFRWKDIFGTNARIPHQNLFDVVHWNTKYATTPNTPEAAAALRHLRHANVSSDGLVTPSLLHHQRPPLPRLVVHDPQTMTDYNGNKNNWAGNFRNATKPYGAGLQVKMFTRYKQYVKRLNQDSSKRHSADLAILKGALRPHPELQQVIVKARQLVMGSDKKRPTYMCFHARVEPDMQKHPVCRDKKVTSLRQIVNDLYRQFPTPPVDRVLIVLYRELLERENVTANPLAGENLQLLNDIAEHGLWNGTVPVHEAGTDMLDKATYFGQKAASIGGSIVNYQMAVEADYFVGSEVSSWAMHVMSTRYSRGLETNYLYDQQGLHQPDPTKEPPRFAC